MSTVDRAGLRAAELHQNLYLTERVAALLPSHATPMSTAWKAAKSRRPPGAGHPQLVACLERIHSHFLWLGVAAMKAGSRPY